MKKKAGFIIIVILLLVIFGPVLFKFLTQKSVSRIPTTSAFVELSQGPVEYRLDGPASGETVVLVSGFSVPLYCWDFIYGPLVDQGYRVLRYNHYGRGLSARSSQAYSLELFENQLGEVLTALELDKEPVHLVGLSMGGLISTTFTVHNPELIRSLTLISPSGYPIEESFSSKLVKFPVIGDYIMAVFGDGILSGRNPDNLRNHEEHPEFLTQFEEQLKYRGAKAALLSTLRHTPFTNYDQNYPLLQQTDVPLLVFWGAEDAVLPFEQSQQFLADVPRAEFIGILEAGHNSQYDRPQVILSSLIDFLENHGR